MKGAVVYNSKWGNCRQVAESVSRGLRDAGHEVTMIEVPAKDGLDESTEFIVAGSPTRVGKMTGPMRRFLKHRVGKDWAGKPFAAFGTGMVDVREKGRKQSADGIYSFLEKKGLRPVAPAYKAGVEDLQGPLAGGELENAFEFGKQLGNTLNQS